MNAYTYFTPKQNEGMVPNRYRRVGKTSRIEFWCESEKEWYESGFAYDEVFINAFSELVEKPADWN